VATVLTCCAVSIGVSAAAASAGSLVYADPVYSTAPSYHGGPPGSGWDNCHVWHSYGGWAWNYGDYYGSGYASLQIDTTDGCNQWSACNVYSNTAAHINDNGCTAWYSWFAGNYADILVGTYRYSHTIYGTGTWP
jgi:hypothetical protein